MIKKQKQILFLSFATLFVLIGALYAQPPEKIDQNVNKQELVQGFIYYANADKTALKSSKTQFSSTLDSHQLGLEILKLVLAGPSRTGLNSTWPKGVAVNSFFIANNGKAYVDLNIPPESKKKMRQSSDTKTELLAIYSLVNSLTVNVPKIKEVKILLQGKDAPTLIGHVDLDYFYKTNMLIVK